MRICMFQRTDCFLLGFVFRRMYIASSQEPQTSTPTTTRFVYITNKMHVGIFELRRFCLLTFL